MNQHTPNEIVQKINRGVIVCILLVIAITSGFYLYSTIQTLLGGTSSNRVVIQEELKIVSNEEKESLLLRIRQVGNADIEESKRLDVLRNFSIKKTVDVKERESALSALKQ